MTKLKVNFVGHVDRDTGYGRAARDWCQALSGNEAIDLGVETLDEDPLKSIYKVPNDFGITHNRPDVVVIHERIPWAPGAPEVDGDLVDWLDARGWSSATVVLATAWEVRGIDMRLRESVTVNQYDALIVPTEQSRDWLCHPQFLRTHGAIHVVPHAVDLNFWHRELRDPREATDQVQFLYVGQWNDRKYPAGVLKAYLAAFDHADREQVRLHLHVPGMLEEQMLELKGILASSGIPVAELPPLTVTTEHLSNEQLRDLYWRSDVFVSAARGEGFNLPAVEAAACGCEVLSTEAATPAFALEDVEDDVHGVRTVGQTMVPVFPGGSVRAVGGGVRFESSFPRGVTCRQQWAEPDLGHLASEMRESMYEHDRAIQRECLERFSYKNVGKQFGDLLREVADRKGKRR